MLGICFSLRIKWKCIWWRSQFWWYRTEDSSEYPLTSGSNRYSLAQAGDCLLNLQLSRGFSFIRDEHIIVLTSRWLYEVRSWTKDERCCGQRVGAFCQARVMRSWKLAKLTTSHVDEPCSGHFCQAWAFRSDCCAWQSNRPFKGIHR
jgi:hypothetical protein